MIKTIIPPMIHKKLVQITIKTDQLRCAFCFQWQLPSNSLRPSDAGKLTIIGSDNGLPPDRRQAIIWTNAGVL